MASKLHHGVGSVGSWAKRCYFASRAVIEAAIRSHGIGATQWYVLYQLAHAGPTMQKDLSKILKVERSTLTVIVGELVRKGLVTQIPDEADQRQKRLELTGAGEALWRELPDPIVLIHQVAFAGIDEAEIAVAVRVLQTATERLDQLAQGTGSE